MRPRTFLWIILFVAALSTDVSSAQRSILETFLTPFRAAKYITFDILKRSVEDEANTRLLKERNKLQPFISPEEPFPCNIKIGRSKIIPSNVNKLRPGDIDIIAGIGDSLTAGVGLTATNGLQIALENRGMAATAGGSGTWREYLTVPNLLKEYNPKLTGYATATSLTLHKESQLNLAETGTLSHDTPYMAQLLVKRMISHPEVDIKNHWKMVSYLVGPNDFCMDICFQSNITAIIENRRRDLLRVLRILKENLPRTIVNIIPAPNLESITKFTGKKPYCTATHLLECPCLFGRRSVNNRIHFDVMKKWQELELDVANSPEFDSENFTVVVQPFSLNADIPNTKEAITDFSYLSEDCFHMSQKGNARIAISLWHNLWEPVGNKTIRMVELGTRWKCPTEDHPYIYTRRNSLSYVVASSQSYIT